MTTTEAWKQAEVRWASMTAQEQHSFEQSLPYSMQMWARYYKPFYAQPTSIRDQFLAAVRMERAA